MSTYGPPRPQGISAILPASLLRRIRPRSQAAGQDGGTRDALLVIGPAFDGHWQLVTAPTPAPRPPRGRGRRRPPRKRRRRTTAPRAPAPRRATGRARTAGPASCAAAPRRA